MSDTKKLPASPIILTVIGTVLVCVTIHIVVNFFSAIVTGNWQLLNVFYILQLYLLVPSLTEGTWMFVLSYLFLIIVSIAVYYVVVRQKHDSS